MRVVSHARLAIFVAAAAAEPFRLFLETRRVRAYFKPPALRAAGAAIASPWDENIPRTASKRLDRP